MSARKLPTKTCTVCGRPVDAHIRFAPVVSGDSASVTYKQVVFCTLRCLRSWANGLEWQAETAVPA